MSADDYLSHELTDIEMQLRQLSIIPTSVDRDAALFDAGWAAAETVWQQRAHRAKDHSKWRTTSGVLAASIAVLALLLVDRDASRQVVMSPAVTPVHSEGSPRSAKPRRLLPPRRSVSVESVWSHGARLLSRRDMALREVFAEPWELPDDVEIPVSEIKSARELLREFLPSGRRES